MENTALIVDLSGLRCPLPVLRTKKALGQINKGDLLRIFSTDPSAKEDLPAFIKQSGHQIEKIDSVENGSYFYIRKR